MSLIGDRTMKVFAVLFVIFLVTDARPQQQQQQQEQQEQQQQQQQQQQEQQQQLEQRQEQQQQQSYVQIPSQSNVNGQQAANPNLYQQLQQIAPNPRQAFYVPAQQQQQLQPYNQQQYLVQQPIQLQFPIPNNGVEEKKIYVQLPPEQYPQQQPQYRYPPRKHYKIILVRSPPQPTPPPAPVVPEIEEQTLVYVLVKKPDTPSAAQLEQLQQQQQQSFKLNKPEVYFIKYKGNEQSPDGSLSGIPSEAIEKSIEQQLSNNLGGGGGEYGANTIQERQSKNLKEDEAEKVVVE